MPSKTIQTFQYSIQPQQSLLTVFPKFPNLKNATIDIDAKFCINDSLSERQQMPQLKVQTIHIWPFNMICFVLENKIQKFANPKMFGSPQNYH